MRIAVIPAKKNSIRLKNKNIKKFNGKPMLYWTIKACLKSKIFDYVFVSTDCKITQKISIKYGASCPFLRKKHNTNRSSTDDVVYESLNEINKKLKLNYDEVFLLMPNCPLRNSKDIINFKNYFVKNNLSFLCTIIKFPNFLNPNYSLYGKKMDHLNFLYRKFINTKYKPTNHFFSLTGAIRSAKVSDFLKHKNFINKKTKYYEIKLINGIDIDDITDFEFAERTKLLT
jgi:CMP-N-acetylneuraminic acid synthetase